MWVVEGVCVKMIGGVGRSARCVVGGRCVRVIRETCERVVV